MHHATEVAVVGLGYIGLPTAAAIAAQGVPVVGVDIVPSTVDAVNDGRVPFAEPDLAVAVSGAVRLGHLRASTVMPEADVYVLAVPTPVGRDRQADLTHVYGAVKSVAARLRPGSLVIIESTVPPGTTVEVSRFLAEERPDLRMPHEFGETSDVRVAHCPERVLPGRIMIEIVTNHRVVGGVTARCAEAARQLYERFSQGKCILTTSTTAELVKLAENSYRDVNIAFANELSMISDTLGVSVWDVIALANMHPRVQILQPGPGVGGHCIAVDPWFIVSSDPKNARLIRTAREVNDGKPAYVAEAIVRASKAKQEAALLGLTFKANVDDIRESPSIEVATAVAERLPSTRINVVEPHLITLPPVLADRNVVLTELDEALERSETVALLVDHDAFRAIEPAKLAHKSLVDTRGFWSHDPLIGGQR